ncbi:DUF1330 domain-containing protein [Acinetobacter pollinis]|uniref:DUF1330 domain-containing protein n=1 Tax=Acinetobacter pollinis TaxID=2605270 RepID=A0ABU6DSX2_9GAMM|nr:DUF1330 domain-containing protein [Acinetobacter pollinis]MEB5476032.1 DUF1330 domain-containing protein [Acinetobacter pollinis]
MNQQKPAYFIFNVIIHHLEEMKPYQDKVTQTYLPYGGELIVHDSHVYTLEGEPPKGHLVILQFQTLEKAKAWYASKEYQDIIPFREKTSTTHAWLVEGIFHPNTNKET